MKKSDVLQIIDEVMNNREIDSIRNAILAIRDKVIELKDDDYEDNLFGFKKTYAAKIPLRGNNRIDCIGADWYEGAKYLYVDSCYKIDTGIYGGYWYGEEEEE